jgi:hypothetical protein
VALVDPARLASPPATLLAALYAWGTLYILRTRLSAFLSELFKPSTLALSITRGGGGGTGGGSIATLPSSAAPALLRLLRPLRPLQEKNRQIKTLQRDLAVSRLEATEAERRAREAEGRLREFEGVGSPRDPALPLTPADVLALREMASDLQASLKVCCFIILFSNLFYCIYCTRSKDIAREEKKKEKEENKT